MPVSRVRAAVERLSPYVPGEQPRDPSVLKLNTNENPYPPSPRVAAALVEQSDRFRLYPDPSCAPLRAALANLHGCEPEQIIVGNGSDETLALCTRAFVEPDGLIAWLEPSYSLYPVLTAIQDVRHETVPLAADYGWTLPAGFGADLFFLTNPNAPTSRAAPPAQVRGLCDRIDGVVVIDEAYADFADSDCLGLAKSLDNTIVMRTFSKSYSLAGLRVGYAVGPRPLIEALHKVRDSYNVNLLTQLAAEAAVADQEHLRSTVAKVVATRERTTEALRERGWDVIDSQANFLFARPPKAAADVFAALRGQGVLVRYFPGPLTGDRLRITVGTDRQMERFLAACDAI